MDRAWSSLARLFLRCCTHGDCLGRQSADPGGMFASSRIPKGLTQEKPCTLSTLGGGVQTRIVVLNTLLNKIL